MEVAPNAGPLSHFVGVVTLGDLALLVLAGGMALVGVGLLVVAVRMRSRNPLAEGWSSSDPLWRPET